MQLAQTGVGQSHPTWDVWNIAEEMVEAGADPSTRRRESPQLPLARLAKKKENTEFMAKIALSPLRRRDRRIGTPCDEEAPCAWCDRLPADGMR